VAVTVLAFYEPYVIDFPYVWGVPSLSDPEDTQHVDLSHYNGNGECSCGHFVCKCGDKLKAGAAPAAELRCVHIEAASSALGKVYVAVAMKGDAASLGVPVHQEAGFADWPAKPGFNV